MRYHSSASTRAVPIVRERSRNGVTSVAVILLGLETLSLMDTERASSRTSLMDVLDRVLDKGVVIDAWLRISLVGIDLVALQAHVVVASMETVLRHSAALAPAKSAARRASEWQRRISLAASLPTARRAQYEGCVLPSGRTRAPTSRRRVARSK
jgi:gas vesicle structural protein